MPFPRQGGPYLKRCSRCEETKPANEFYSEPRNRDGLKSHCNTCCVEIANSWRKKDPKRHRTYNRQWAQRNQDSIRNTRMKRLYGVTIEEYAGMLAAQQGACAICGVAEPGGKGDMFHVDHCHDTGVIRGLLCHSCNLAIGHLKHSHGILQAAIDYLKINRTPR